MFRHSNLSETGLEFVILFFYEAHILVNVTFREPTCSTKYLVCNPSILVLVSKISSAQDKDVLDSPYFRLSSHFSALGFDARLPENLKISLRDEFLDLIFIARVDTLKTRKY